MTQTRRHVGLWPRTGASGAARVAAGEVGALHLAFTLAFLGQTALNLLLCLGLTLGLGLALGLLLRLALGLLLGLLLSLLLGLLLGSLLGLALGHR